MAMVNMTQIEPLQDATDLLHQPEDLRRQAAEDGYLFFAGLLDSVRVLKPSQTNSVNLCPSRLDKRGNGFYRRYCQTRIRW